MKEGFSFIEFEDQTDAADAIKRMNRTDVFGHGIITVRPAK